MKLRHRLHFICLLLIFAAIVTFSEQTYAQQSMNASTIMKVKPHHSTAVYEDNSKNAKKLFHTTANNHVIVHNQTKNGWSYIQDSTKFGYIATSSLTTASSLTVKVISTEGALIRTLPTLNQKPIATLAYKETVKAFAHSNDWYIVKMKNGYGYAPAGRLQKVVTLDTARYSTGKARTQKRVALTFDDGPNTVYTASILNTLKKYNVKATFFLVGSNVARNPAIAKRIVTEGHEIGSHTYSHPKLTTISSKKVVQEMTKTNNAIKKATGTSPTVFRPPYGAINSKIIQQANLPTILWSVDTLDWQHRDPKELLQVVQKQVKNGSIILMHDTNIATQKGLESVIRYLQQNDYILVTASELLQN